MDVSIILVALICITFYLIYFINKRNKYWQKRNVPYIKPVPLLGNYGKYIFLQEYVGEMMQKLCQKFPDEPYFGAFFGTEPVLVVQSPEILKLVLTIDFDYFHGREISKYRDREVITQNLFFASGSTWKMLRQNLNVLFSTAKMKNMFYLIERCCYKFETMLDLETSIDNVIEAKDFCARYTMDCIISCSFGVEAKTMDEPDNNYFLLIANELFKSTNFRGFKIVFRSIWPAIFYALRLKLFSPAVDAFFSDLLKNVFVQRNYTPSSRNDFVDLLLKFRQDEFLRIDKRNSKDNESQLKVDDDLLTSMCVLFFGAGFETSASTLSFTLFELAKNPDVQQRAAEEVDEYLRRHGNKLDYNIAELCYLDACVYETIRKYPVIGNLTREVMADYILPDGLHLNKGIRIHIPVYSLHHNPKYFPEPDAYKPERFLSENKKTLTQYTFFPFGEGPRICLGKRFAKMQILPALVTFLKKYRVELAEGMPATVNLESRSILIQPRDQSLMLKVTQREGWEERMFIQTK